MFCDKVKLVNQAMKTDLGAQFMAEAKRHLDAEAGKVALPTAQGLYVMFLVCFQTGTSRAGTMYRLAALDLLAKLQLEKLLKPEEGKPGEADYRRALSKASWSLFNVEW
jgi:hypothetical protein